MSQRSAGRGARERILSAAAELFGRRGINAVAMNEVAAAAPVSKRTLYHHFRSKDELVVAYLHLRALDPAAPEAALHRADLTPRARLLELFTALADGPAPPRGNPFVTAAFELADPARPGHLAAVDHERAFVARLAGLARAAGARDPEHVGRRLALLYDGAAARMLVEGSAEPAADAFALAAALLRDAIDVR